MLPKNNRLPLRFSRNYVEADNKVFHSPFFTMSVASSMIGANNPTRFAFIISKKINKSAVTRNSLKRKLVSSLQPYLASITPGFDVILYAKHAIITADRLLLDSEVSKALKKSNLLR